MCSLVIDHHRFLRSLVSKQPVNDRRQRRKRRDHSIADTMRQVPIHLPVQVTADASARFGQWLVDEGGEVLAGDRLAEVLTSGVLVYVAARRTGN